MNSNNEITKKLEEIKALYDLSQKNFNNEILKYKMQISTLETAAMKLEFDYRKVLRLAEDPKNQNEQVKLELEQLQGKLNVLKHMEDGSKEEELQDSEILNQSLIVEERKKDDELQEARKELLKFFKEAPGRANIGVKRMGVLDCRPFLEAMMKKYNEEEAIERASELFSLWEGYLKDPAWHPFQVISVEGKAMEVVNDDDEKLNGLKNEMGEGAYKAVVTALREIKEYNPSDRYIVSEIWNYGQGRRATLKEAVQFLLEPWKILKRKWGMM